MHTSAVAGTSGGAACGSAGLSRELSSHQSGSLTSEVLLGVLEHRAQPRLDVVELRLADGQRRGELDDRVAAVVGTAVDPRVEEGLGEVAAQQPLGLGVV